MRLLCGVSTILLRVDSDLVDNCEGNSQDGKVYTRKLCVQEVEGEMMVILGGDRVILRAALAWREVFFRESSASEQEAVLY